MATNYSISEAVKIIVEGKDTAAITEIGRRFPVLANKIAVVGAKAGKDFVDFMSYIPEYVSANKVNTVIKNSFEDSDESDESDDVENETENVQTAKTAKSNKASKKSESEDDENDSDNTDYDSMTTKELWKLVQERGLKKACGKDLKKANLIKVLKAAGANTEDDSSEDEAEDDENPYEGKTAMELFKECKKRKIKAAPKKTAKFYAELLMKADADANNDDEDDWDDDDAEEVKSAKSAKSKKVEDEDNDDGDDWDI